MPLLPSEGGSTLSGFDSRRFQASYVATAVREETGLTVGDWLREHRMAEARRRLLETATSVESIASQVGYSDVTSFVRGFRRAQEMTPRAPCA